MPLALSFRPPKQHSGLCYAADGAKSPVDAYGCELRGDRRRLSPHHRRGRRRSALFVEAAPPSGFEPVLESLDDASEETALPRYAGKTAVVVGAGIAGTVAAAFLARHGFTVKVFEERGDPTKQAYSLERVTLIRLLPSTISILRDIGIEVPYHGNRHGFRRAKGAARIVGDDVVTCLFQKRPEDFMYIGERNQVAQVIIEDVGKKYASAIAFCYHHKCTEVDFDQKTVTFQEDGEGSVTEGFDLLVAADGSRSAVLESMQKFDRSFRATNIEHKGGYRMIRDLPFLDKNEKIMKGLNQGYPLFVRRPGVVSIADTRRHLPILFLHSSERNTIHCAIFAARESFEVFREREYEWLKKATPGFFPEAWLKEISEKLTTVPTGRIPAVRRISRLYGPATVFLGDAAHCATPTMGLGANSAVEDANALSDALEAANGDLNSVGQIFHRMRIRAARAIGTLQLAADHTSFKFRFSEMWTKYMGWVHMSVMGGIRRIFPSLASPELVESVDLDKLTPLEASWILFRDAVVVAVCIVAAAVFLVRYLLSRAIPRL